MSENICDPTGPAKRQGDPASALIGRACRALMRQPSDKSVSSKNLHSAVSAGLAVLLAIAITFVSRIATAQVIGVSGNSMTLNGEPWLSRGLNISGFVATPAYESANYPEEYTARINYGYQELAAARAFGADTLRIQISQYAFDSHSPGFDLRYAIDATLAILYARLSGFVVIIMMQDEAISGEPHPHPMATAATMRNWEYLNLVFGHDRGVMFELFNEPKLPANVAGWAVWKNGGNVPGHSIPAIGMQTMITRLRAIDCQNVLVLDANELDGNAAASLQGVPSISDPLNRVVYAIHPYLHGSSNEGQWDAAFNVPSMRLPVYADEWSAQVGSKLGLGSLESYQVAVDLLNDLRSHHISVGGGAFDEPGFMVQAVPGWTPSNYDSFAQGINNPLDDAGLLVHTLFKSDYSRPLTMADGVTP